MVGPYSDKWLEAMKSETGSMYQNKVWTLVDLPDDRQAIEINGSLRRRRTWAVMLPSMKLDLWERVFSQVQGVDYDENFSPAAMLKASAGEAQTQNGQTHLHRIPKGESWVYLLSQIRGQIVCR